MIIKNSEKRIKEKNDNFTVYDYKVGSLQTGLNLYEIHGRMPEKNYMITRKTDRVFMVVEGVGISYVDGIARTIEKGDVVLVTMGAKFYFEGYLSLVGLKK